MGHRLILNGRLLKMQDDPKNPNNKGYKAELIVIITLMIIVGAYIAFQVVLGFD